MKRPKSQVMLCIYGARFKPQAYREKHTALYDRSKQKSKANVQSRARQLTEATAANSSVADAFRVSFGMAGPSSTMGPDSFSTMSADSFLAE